MAAAADDDDNAPGTFRELIIFGLIVLVPFVELI